jgi:hypothetical protein
LAIRPESVRILGGERVSDIVAIELIVGPLLNRNRHFENRFSEIVRSGAQFGTGQSEAAPSSEEGHLAEKALRLFVAAQQ